MVILMWLLSLAAYLGLVLFLGEPPSELILIAMLLGLVGLAVGKRGMLLVSFVIILFAELLVYPLIITGLLGSVWLAAIALTVFFAALTLRPE